MSGFYDVQGLQQIAVNLFYGWGYNFYRLENQLRADDQLIRRKVGDILEQVTTTLSVAESTYRRLNLPAPSRERPYPDPKAVQAAQSLERLIGDVGVLKSRINALPVPESDLMTKRFRDEADTLKALITCDELLVGQSELLRTTLADLDSDRILMTLPAINEGIQALQETLQRRKALLNP